MLSKFFCEIRVSVFEKYIQRHKSVIEQKGENIFKK